MIKEKDKKKNKEILSVDERLRKEEEEPVITFLEPETEEEEDTEDFEEVKDFGLSPDEYEEEILSKQPPSREKDCEIQTKNLPHNLLEQRREAEDKKKIIALTTKDLKEK